MQMYEKGLDLNMQTASKSPLWLMMETISLAFQKMSKMRGETAPPQRAIVAIFVHRQCPFQSLFRKRRYPDASLSSGA